MTDYFVLRRTPVEANDCLLDLESHWDTHFFSGKPLGDIVQPVQLRLDADTDSPRLPTLFDSPGLVVDRPFLAVLDAGGVVNLERFTTRIIDPRRRSVIDEYMLINVIGIVACADLAASEGSALGPDILVLDRIVLRRARLLGAPSIFRLAEDPLRLIVSHVLAARIDHAGFADIQLEPLEVLD